MHFGQDVSKYEDRNKNFTLKNIREPEIYSQREREKAKNEMKLDFKMDYSSEKEVSEMTDVAEDTYKQMLDFEQK